MLGSLAEADDAVQEAWLRLGRADAAGIANLGGWLTTVVARVCLDLLRPARPGARSPSTPTCPTRWSAAPTGSAPSRRRCWPIRWGWPCWWSWTPSPQPSGWPSCFTTCSLCPSGRSPRSPTPTWAVSARRWTPSWPRPATATSTPCWRCSTPTWSSGPTTVPCPPAWPGRPWSTGPPAWSWPATAGHCRSWGSRWRGQDRRGRHPGRPRAPAPPRPGRRRRLRPPGARPRPVVTFR
jgi:sigma-70-like protein